MSGAVLSLSVTADSSGAGCFVSAFAPALVIGTHRRPLFIRDEIRQLIRPRSAAILDLAPVSRRVEYGSVFWAV